MYFVLAKKRYKRTTEIMSVDKEYRRALHTMDLVSQDDYSEVSIYSYGNLIYQKFM